MNGGHVVANRLADAATSRRRTVEEKRAYKAAWARAYRQTTTGKAAAVRANEMRRAAKTEWARKNALDPAFVARRRLIQKKSRDKPESKEKQRAYQRAQYALPSVKRKRREQARQSLTGFSPETFATTLQKQGHRCAVCERDLRPLPARQICADHCHDTGRPRGVLCSWCNTVEGFIRSSGLEVLAFANRLDAYLRSPPVKIL